MTLTGRAKKTRSDLAATASRLRELYARRGQLRVPDKTRYRKRGQREYKHGYELRFRTYSDAELAEVLRLLHTVGIPTGRPYPVSSSGMAVSVYGKQRTLSAVRDLRLRRPPVRAACHHRVLRTKAPPRLVFATSRQLEVAMLMYDRGPLTARKANTTPMMLAGMERLRLVRPARDRSKTEEYWVLTPWGKEQTRRGRWAHLDWLRSGKRTRFPNRQC